MTFNPKASYSTGSGSWGQCPQTKTADESAWPTEIDEISGACASTACACKSKSDIAGDSASQGKTFDNGRARQEDNYVLLGIIELVLDCCLQSSEGD